MELNVHMLVEQRRGGRCIGKAHANLVHEVNRLRETLAQIQSALEVVQTHLQVLEQHQPQLEGQLDVFIRMMHPAAQPPFLARAPPRSRGLDPDMA